MAREQLPRFVSPMLARSGVPCDARGWAFEVKFDGMRAQLLDDGKRCLRSRPGRDCTDAFPELAPLSGEFRGRRLLLGGELVCLNDEGVPDFAHLRARLRSAGREAHLAAKRAPVTFLAFDLLHLDGRSMRELPYIERRAVLAELALDGPRWRTPRTFASGQIASEPLPYERRAIQLTRFAQKALRHQFAWSSTRAARSTLRWPPAGSGGSVRAPRSGCGLGATARRPRTSARRASRRTRPRTDDACS